MTPETEEKVLVLCSLMQRQSAFLEMGYEVAAQRHDPRIAAITLDQENALDQVYSRLFTGILTTPTQLELPGFESRSQNGHQLKMF